MMLHTTHHVCGCTTQQPEYHTTTRIPHNTQQYTTTTQQPYTQNKATVTYYLLMDNRRQLPGAYFREEMPEYAEAHMQHPTGRHGDVYVGGCVGGYGGGCVCGGWVGGGGYICMFTLRIAPPPLHHHTTTTHPPPSRHHHPHTTTTPPSPPPPGIMSTSFTTRGMSLHADAPTGRVVVERQWRLGLPSRGHPSAIMQELFVLFKNHQVFWKKTTPYNLKCRCVVEVDGMWWWWCSGGSTYICLYMYTTHIFIQHPPPPHNTHSHKNNKIHTK